MSSVTPSRKRVSFDPNQSNRYRSDFAIQESNPGALDILVASKRPETRVEVTRFRKLRTFLGKYATFRRQYGK